MKTPWVFLLLILARSANSQAAPEFAKRITEAQTGLQCHFDYTSERTKEHFRGQIRIQSTGIAEIIMQRDSEAPNECKLDLLQLAMNPSTVDGRATVLLTRTHACRPQLTQETRKRFNDEIELTMPRNKKKKAVTGQIATASLFYLEGLNDCTIDFLNEKTLQIIEKQIVLGTLKPRPQYPAIDPLDISDEIKRLKAEKLIK